MPLVFAAYTPHTPLLIPAIGKEQLEKLIKEWCMWEDLGYMCHEHPTPLANKLFAEYLKPSVVDWLNRVKK